MDNLTHTLVGVLVGESAARAVPATAGSLQRDVRRNLFVTLMAIGSNVPDLDFIQSRVTDSKLDYLLHHRGHTHTILGALIIAGLLYLASVWWCRWRRHSLDRFDRMQIAGIAVLATLLHIALDATNSYGVHPFWPFDNRWYYGDAVFIVEPLFWASCAPLVFLLRSLLARSLVALALIAGIALSVTTAMVPPLMSGVLTCMTLALLAVGKVSKPPFALATALFVWLAINAAFIQASAIAKRRTAAIVAQEFPAAQLLDIVLTPLPVNPFCWHVLIVQADAKHSYVRRAVLSIAADIIPARGCPSRPEMTNTTAKFVAIAAVSTGTIAWHGEAATSIDRLQSSVADDCHAFAFMRFARAPWLIQKGSTWIVGDARFDHEQSLGFAEIELDSKQECMAYVPPWTAPRADLLGQ